MRKLVFKLVSNAPKNSTLPKNLEISTHKSSKLLLRGNLNVALDVSDDPMSDAELLTWYKTRYAGFGVGISIIKDPVATPVVPVETKEVDLEKCDSVVEDSAEKCEATVSIEKTEPVSKVEPKFDVDKASYEELLAFAKEKNIVLKSGRGRSEECVRKTIAEWMKND